jgi:hypothetical protein
MTPASSTRKALAARLCMDGGHCLARLLHRWAVSFMMNCAGPASFVMMFLPNVAAQGLVSRNEVVSHGGWQAGSPSENTCLCWIHSEIRGCKSLTHALPLLLLLLLLLLAAAGTSRCVATLSCRVRRAAPALKTRHLASAPCGTTSHRWAGAV